MLLRLPRGKAHCSCINLCYEHLIKKSFIPSYCPSSQVVPSVYVNRRHFIHRISEITEERLKQYDSIPQEYCIIYRAPLKNYVKFTYTASFISVVGIPFMIGVAFLNAADRTFPVMLSGLEIIHNYYELCGFIIGLGVICTQIGVTVFRYPLRLYKSNEKGHYIIVYQHVLPWKYKKEEFIAGELKKIESSIMPWKDCLYEFRSKKAILLDTHFRRPADLQEMLLEVKENDKP